jgi:hypothetical protein
VTPIFHKLSAGEDERSEIDSEISNLRARIEELEKKRATLI